MRSRAVARRPKCWAVTPRAPRSQRHAGGACARRRPESGDRERANDVACVGHVGLKRTRTATEATTSATALISPTRLTRWSRRGTRMQKRSGGRRCSKLRQSATRVGRSGTMKPDLGSLWSALPNRLSKTAKAAKTAKTASRDHDRYEPDSFGAVESVPRSRYDVSLLPVARGHRGGRAVRWWRASHEGGAHACLERTGVSRATNFT
jgi:hypothetical protein